MRTEIIKLKNIAIPVIRISLTSEKLTREKKQELITGATDLMVNVLNKDPHLTHIIIEEVSLDDWGYAGEQSSVLREKGITADKKIDKQ